MEYDVKDIAGLIQLAMAPAFLLVAIAGILQLFAARLARVIDRSRILEEEYDETVGEEHDHIVHELRNLNRRMWVVNFSVLMGVCGAFTIALLIVMLFMMALSALDLSTAIASGFILAMAFVMTGLASFMYEVRLGNRNIVIPERYLELDRR